MTVQQGYVYDLCPNQQSPSVCLCVLGPVSVSLIVPLIQQDTWERFVTICYWCCDVAREKPTHNPSTSLNFHFGLSQKCFFSRHNVIWIKHLRCPVCLTNLFLICNGVCVRASLCLSDMIKSNESNCICHMLRKQQVWTNSDMLTYWPFPTMQRERK